MTQAHMKEGSKQCCQEAMPGRGYHAISPGVVAEAAGGVKAAVALVEGATVLLLVSTGVLVAGSCALVEGTAVLVLGATVLLLMLGRAVVLGTAMLDCTVVDGADVLTAGAAVVASGAELLDCTVVDGADMLAAGADVLASCAVLLDAGAAVLVAGSCAGAGAPHCGVAWIAVGQDCMQLPVRTMFTVAPCTKEQVPQRYTSRSGLSCWHWSPMMRSCSEAETVVSLPSVAVQIHSGWEQGVEACCRFRTLLTAGKKPGWGGACCWDRPPKRLLKLLPHIEGLACRAGSWPICRTSMSSHARLLHWSHIELVWL